MTTTASLVMTAAHAAAKLADKVVAYRTRFTTALRAAWAATKQTIQAVMSTTGTYVISRTAETATVHMQSGTAPAYIATFALTAAAKQRHQEEIAAAFAGDNRKTDAFDGARELAAGPAELVDVLGAPYYFSKLRSAEQVDRMLGTSLNHLIVQDAGQYAAAERHEDNA